MVEKPNVHLFKVYDESFLYDVDTNAIVKIPQYSYDYLSSILACSNRREIEEKTLNMKREVKESLL